MKNPIVISHFHTLFAPVQRALPPYSSEWSVYMTPFSVTTHLKAGRPGSEVTHGVCES